MRNKNTPHQIKPDTCVTPSLTHLCTKTATCANATSQAPRRCPPKWLSSTMNTRSDQQHSAPPQHRAGRPRRWGTTRVSNVSSTSVRSRSPEPRANTWSAHIQHTQCSMTANGVMAPLQVRVRDLGMFSREWQTVMQHLDGTAYTEGGLKQVKKWGGPALLALHGDVLRRRRCESCCDTSYVCASSCSSASSSPPLSAPSCRSSRWCHHKQRGLAVEQRELANEVGLGVIHQDRGHHIITTRKQNLAREPLRSPDPVAG